MASQGSTSFICKMRIIIIAPTFTKLMRKHMEPIWYTGAGRKSSLTLLSCYLILPGKLVIWQMGGRGADLVADRVCVLSEVQPQNGHSIIPISGWGLAPSSNKRGIPFSWYLPTKQCSATSCCLSKGPLISESLPAKHPFLRSGVLMGWVATQAGSVPHRQTEP